MSAAVRALVGLSCVALSAAASCGVPSAGAQVVTLECGMAGGFPRLDFTLTTASRRAGSFQLHGTPFCLTVNGTIASDGMPAIQLRDCTYPNDPWQTFADLADGTGGWVSSVTGDCLDAVSGVQAPLEAMELYGCDGGQPNQRHTYNATTGQLTNGWGYCVGFC